MYFCEDGYVVASFYYSDYAQRLWTYIPEKSVDSSAIKRIKKTFDLKGYEGTISQSTFPIWTLDVENPKDCDWYYLKKGTKVTVYLKEKDYVLAEFYGTSTVPEKTGKVRMWIPINCVDF